MALMVGWTQQKKRISKLTDRAIENLQTETKIKKMNEKNRTKNLRSVRQYHIKHFTIYVIEVPKERTERTGQENI